MSEKYAGVIHRVGLCLRGTGSEITHTPFSLNIPGILCQNSRKRKRTATICLTIVVLLGSAGVAWSADLQKGFTAYQSGDYATSLCEWTPLAEQGDAYATSQGFVFSGADTGCGIPEDKMDIILQPFGQADMTIQRNYEGTGLGLPLVKAMVELHDGTLEIFSRDGKGTTATVRFPIDRVIERQQKLAS
mgnify:FL=1